MRREAQEANVKTSNSMSSQRSKNRNEIKIDTNIAEKSNPLQSDPEKRRLSSGKSDGNKCNG